MFQPTPFLTFRTVTSLGLLRIHRSIPLSPEESARLLNLLTISFRRQLDLEHGTVGSERGAGYKVLDSISPSKLPHEKHQQHMQSRPNVRSPTDSHLHSILTNPLFKNVEKGSNIKSLQLRDPMEIFDEAYAKGFMKVEYAAACLKATKQRIKRSSAPSVRDGMKHSGAGSKTLKWMLASGVADDKSFLKNEGFSEVLIDFLVAEELESVIWTWVETSILESSSFGAKPASIPSTRIARQLLYYLVKAQTSESTSLEIAFRSLGRVENMLSGLEYRCETVLQRSAKHLYNTVVHQPASPGRSSPEMFDLFLSIISKVMPLGNEIAVPSLLLHHPTKPDAKPALKFLEKVKNIVSATSEPESRHAAFRARYCNDAIIMNLGLNTAKFLFEHDQHTKACWVMKFLDETFGNLLGPRQVGLFSLHNQVQAESSSLELLNSLNLV